MSGTHEGAQDLWQEVVLADERAREGRVERLKLLNKGASTDEIPMPALAAEYFEEARLCWYTGAFIAAILLSQLSFEGLLRSRYRASNGVGGKLSDGTKIDAAQFSQLIKAANKDGTINAGEYDRIDHIRTTRNAYVHTKDPSKVANKSNAFQQTLKVAAPHLVGVSLEDEARRCIATLVELFGPLCARSWGLTHHIKEKV